MGRACQLQVYVNDKKIYDKIIEGLYESSPSDGRQGEDVKIDLSDFRAQEVVLRLYQRVLVPHKPATPIGARWKFN